MNKFNPISLLVLLWLALTSEAQTFEINQGITGTWYNPDSPGQGLLIETFLDTKQLFVAWFSYDRMSDTSEQEWWSAIGGFDTNQAELEIYQTNGGLFNQSTAVNNINVGGMQIEFTDCYHAILKYKFIDMESDDMIQLKRLVPDNLCEESINE